jgi:RNase P/RNase MRP subunit p30
MPYKATKLIFVSETVAFVIRTTRILPVFLSSDAMSPLVHIAKLRCDA